MGQYMAPAIYIAENYLI
jgi:hypothetical protein